MYRWTLAVHSLHLVQFRFLLYLHRIKRMIWANISKITYFTFQWIFIVKWFSLQIRTHFHFDAFTIFYPLFKNSWITSEEIFSWEHFSLKLWNFSGALIYWDCLHNVNLSKTTSSRLKLYYKQNVIKKNHPKPSK